VPCSVNWPRCAYPGLPARGLSRFDVIALRVTQESTAELESPLRFFTRLTLRICCDPHSAPSDAFIARGFATRIDSNSDRSRPGRVFVVVPTALMGFIALRSFIPMHDCGRFLSPRSHLPFFHESAHDWKLSCMCRAGRQWFLQEGVPAGLVDPASGVISCTSFPVSIFPSRPCRFGWQLDQRRSTRSNTAVGFVPLSGFRKAAFPDSAIGALD
jgi:hypothetical protein